MKRIELNLPAATGDPMPKDPRVIKTGGVQEPKDKQHQHWLIITNNAEDTGQEGYYEDLEWEIEHSPQCPYEVMRYYDFGGGEQKHYLCRVGQEVMNIGIDGLEYVTGTGDGWTELEPGRYEIEAWSSGPSYPDGEWDGGLRFVDP